MKLSIEKSQFTKSWSLAERSVGTSSALNVLSGILVRASESTVELLATDLKTSVTCRARGVRVEVPGEAVFPVKSVGDLFRKAPEGQFSVSVEEGKATLLAGRSRYRFSTYGVQEFPRLPSAEQGTPFGTTTAQQLFEALSEGTLAASTGEEYPQFLSCAYFQPENGFLRVVSTDSRRLAYSRFAVGDAAEGPGILLPMKGIKELERILGSLDGETPLKVRFDDAQAYFSTSEVEFAVRRVEAKFPQYERILPTSRTTWFEAGRSSLVEALERIDVVVRDFTRMVVLQLSPGGSCTLRGRAPDFGEAVEEVEGSIEGEPLRIAFNVRFFLDGLKALKDQGVRLDFNGPEGHLAIRRPGSDSYLCLVAPIALTEEDGGAEGDAL